MPHLPVPNRKHLRPCLAGMAAALLLGPVGVHAADSPEPSAAAQDAQVAAVADAASTWAVLSGGGFELNPLLPTSPAGLLGLTALKLGLARHLDGLPTEEREFGLKASTALWGGAAMNNLLAAASVAPPLGLVAGLTTGAVLWWRTAQRLQDERAADQREREAIQALFLADEDARLAQAAP